MENQPLQPAASSAHAAEEAGKAPVSRERRAEELSITTVPSSDPVRQKSQGQRTCPNCGATQPTSTSICLACDTFLPNVTTQQIRCRYCRTHASANLQLCPGCGRTLLAAPTPLVSWIAPALLVLLFLFFLQRWVGGSPWQWTQSQANAGWAWLTTVGERLDPQITISTLPAVAENRVAQNGQRTANPVRLAQLDANAISGNADMNNNNGEGGASGSGFNSQAVLPLTTTTATATLLALPTPVPTVVEPTATTAPSATPSATALSPTATSSATPRPTRTATARATATSRATLASPTAVATNVGRTLVQGTPGGAVVAAAATPTAERTGTILQPTPTAVATATTPPTATPVPSPTPSPAPATVYVLKSGDTPSAVASRYGVTVNALLAANGLGINDARRLRVGQTLIIPDTSATAPAATSPPTATAPPTVPSTVPPTATATTAAAADSSSTNEAAEDASAIRLDAPQLRSPESGSFLSCGAENSLIWLPVPFIREDDNYLLHLGFVSGYNTDGAETVTWVLEQLQAAHVTIWRMDEGLCSLAPQEYGRQWRWYVEVVETAGDRLQPVSLPSTVWAFNWN